MSDRDRFQRCRDCHARIFWVSTSDRRRLALDDGSIALDRALADPKDVFYLAETGRALPWTPMIVADVGDLFRAHRTTCTAQRFNRNEPVPEPAPLQLVTPPEPDPQLRLPVLPRRRPGATPSNPSHERGNHEHHHVQAA